MDTYFLKALLHAVIGALPSPGSVSLTAGFETWLRLHQCRESWETDAQDSHWEKLSRALFSLSAILQVTRKNWHEIKRAVD